MILFLFIFPFFNFFISRNLSFLFQSQFLRFIIYPVSSIFLLVTPMIFYGYQSHTWAEGIELFFQFPGIIIFWLVYMIRDFVYPWRMNKKWNIITNKKSINKEYLLYSILWFYCATWIIIYNNDNAYYLLILIFFISLLINKNVVINKLKLLLNEFKK